MNEEILETVRQAVDNLLKHKAYIQVSDVGNYSQVRALNIGSSLLRNAVYKLVNDGYIIEIQKSSGRRPALYSKPKTDESLHNETLFDLETQTNGFNLNLENSDLWIENLTMLLENYGLKLAEYRKQEQEIDQKLKELRHEKQLIQEKISDLREKLKPELEKFTLLLHLKQSGEQENEK